MKITCSLWPPKDDELGSLTLLLLPFKPKRKKSKKNLNGQRMSGESTRQEWAQRRITNVIHTDNLWLLTLELIKSNRIRLMAERNGMENNNEANKSTFFSCRLKKYSVQLRPARGEWMSDGEWWRCGRSLGGWWERGWRRVERRLSVPKRSSFFFCDCCLLIFNYDE